MRSMLYTPADMPERAIKAWRFNPDAIILDLEDGVSTEKKQNARENIKEIMDSSDSLWYIRVNSVRSGILIDDVPYLFHKNLKGIILPKVETEFDVFFLEELLREYSKKSMVSIKNVKLIPILESAKGIANIKSIANSSNNIQALVFGGADLSLDLKIKWDPESLLFKQLMNLLVLESRNAGLEPPHDTVYPYYNDPTGLKNKCLEAKNIGFGTKHAIHPNQIQIINEVFSPTEEEIRNARIIKEEFEKAQAMQKGVTSINSNMIDLPVYLNALRILKNSGVIR